MQQSMVKQINKVELIAACSLVLESLATGHGETHSRSPSRLVNHYREAVAGFWASSGALAGRVYLTRQMVLGGSFSNLFSSILSPPPYHLTVLVCLLCSREGGPTGKLRKCHHQRNGKETTK